MHVRSTPNSLANADCVLSPRASLISSPWEVGKCFCICCYYYMDSAIIALAVTTLGLHHFDGNTPWPAPHKSQSSYGLLPASRMNTSCLLLCRWLRMKPREAT